MPTGAVALRRVAAGQLGVPGSRAAQRDAVDHDVVPEGVRALRDVHLLALRLARVDRGLEGGRGVGRGVAGGAEVVDGQRSGRARDRVGGHLEVGQVDRDRDVRLGLDPDLRAGLVGLAEQGLGLVVEVVGVGVTRVVVERVTAVEPAVHRGQGDVLELGAADADVGVDGLALAAVRVGDAVAHRHRVGGLGQGELDVLTRRVDRDGPAAGGLGGERRVDPVGPDDGAVVGDVLGLELGERNGRAATRDAPRGVGRDGRGGGAGETGDGHRARRDQGGAREDGGQAT